MRKKRRRRIPDQPIAHLLPDYDPDQLIDELAEHLHSVVPNARIDVTEEPDLAERQRSVQIRHLLDKAVRQFLEHESAKRMGRLRFPRYTLLSWLLSQNEQPSDLVDGPNAHTRRLLKRYLSRRSTQSTGRPEAAAWSAAEQQLPWYLFIPMLFLNPVSYGWWVRFGHIPRWFMRQRYLSPGDSEDFPGFAQRLITTPSRRENADQVRRLLVHAFLADLGDAYARGPRWRWIPKDCYPVLLLQGLGPDTIGETLVRLVNDVRNETVSRDPLLIVGAGTEQLEHEAPSESGMLDQWPEQLQAARRRRSPTAWYRPARVVDDSTDQDTPVLRRPHLPLRHSLAWRRVPATALVLALLAGGAVYADWYWGPCGQLVPIHHIGPFGSDTRVSASGEECVGVSDGEFVFTPEIPAAQADSAQALSNQLQGEQAAIVAQNEDIDRDHKRDEDTNPGRVRPYVTVVYFGTLTATDPNSSTLTGTLEELRGLREAQNKSWRYDGVLMRVVFANGGNQMAHAPEVADQIADMAARHRDSDAPVVGVVGLGGSWAPTMEAARRLGHAGLPSIGTTTSADQLVDATPLYHQIVPNNRRQAQVIGQYLRHRFGENLPHITVFNARGDLYSENLATDLSAEFHLQQPARDLDELSDPSRDVPCGDHDLLFLAGRADQLGEFLKQVSDRCQQPPLLMAGDDVSKFMLDNSLPTGMKLEYVSFYGVDDCPTDKLSGRGMLTNDTIEVLGRAVRNLTHGSVSASGEDRAPLEGLSVWHGITEIKGPERWSGTTGDIDYGGESDQVPADKLISVLRMTGGASTPEVPWVSGQATPRGCVVPGP